MRTLPDEIPHPHRTLAGELLRWSTRAFRPGWKYRATEGGRLSFALPNETQYQWMVTCTLPSAVDAVAELLGGTPYERETEAEDAMAVKTDADRVEVVIDGPDAVKTDFRSGWTASWRTTATPASSSARRRTSGCRAAALTPSPSCGTGAPPSPAPPAGPVLRDRSRSRFPGERSL